MRELATAAVLGLSLTLAACGADGPAASASAQTVVHEGERFSDGVPAPASPAALTVHGATGPPNDGDAISLDVETLERLGLHQWTVFEPFLDEDTTFRGVPFETVLEAVGVPDTATEMLLTALDDYAVTIPLETLRSGDVLLVTQDPTPGPIGVDRGGPIRFIWRDGSESATNPDLWIWSLREAVFQ